jgi:hypothetical protein
MKTQILLTLFFTFLFLDLISQIHLREVFRVRDTLRIGRFEPNSEMYAFKKIKMAPGDHRISERNTSDFLATQQIVSIDLVYSDFPPGINLSELNRKRFLELAKFLPEAFQDKHIQWRVVLQTGVTKTGDPYSFFHGFVVYYKPYDLSAELSSITEATKGIYKNSDSVLLKIFERHLSWKNMLVVMDVTGSMYPYTAQMILWLKLNTIDDKFKHFTFFNDGDLKSSEVKKVGETGGIYQIASSAYKPIAIKVEEAMKAGNGGDIQENDIEALLKGIDACPTCSDIVLIADNFSPCRDLSLLKNVKKPVKVILCGVQSFVNIEYLQIAYETGGSVHTMESDINNLIKMKEGQSVEIDGYEYKIQKGKFVKVSK